MNRIRAHSIFPQSLKIFEDIIVFRKRHWFSVDEMTITYNHIAQANLNAGIWFSTIEIITSGGSQNTSIHSILKKYAVKAQKIIEQKIYRAHSTKTEKSEFKAKKDTKVSSIEKSLSRLRELKRRGKISEREFENKRKQLLKSIG